MSDRAKVIERDNYTCVTCGAPGHNVHHVVPRGHAKICEMVNSKYNLVVKCMDCHSKSHNQNSRYKDLMYLVQKYGISIYQNAEYDFWREILRRGIE